MIFNYMLLRTVLALSLLLLMALVSVVEHAVSDHVTHSHKSSRAARSHTNRHPAAAHS